MIPCYSKILSFFNFFKKNLIMRLLFHFVIILGSNSICDEGAIELAEMLKLNQNLTKLDLSKFLHLKN